MKTQIAIGGLVAAGFDASGRFLLVVSHAGRGVFDVGSWERVARDSSVVYPEGGVSVGIGPIDGEKIRVQLLDPKTDGLSFTSADGKLALHYDSGTLTVGDPSASRPWWKFWA